MKKKTTIKKKNNLLNLMNPLRLLKNTMVLAILFLVNHAAMANWSHTGQSYRGGLNKIKMVSSNVGYAVGGEYILKTMDGGNNWNGLSIQFPRNSNGDYISLTDLSFVSETEGYVVGNFGTIFKTMDGGRTWLKLSISNNAADFNCVQFVNSLVGYIGDAKGKLFKTINGGLSWVAQTTSITTSINTVFFTDANTGWFAGMGGVLKKTTDGGASWTTQTSGTTANINSLFFLSANNGWFTINSSVVKTTNGGANWSVVNAAQTYAFQIFFTDANTGWLTNLASTNTLQKTTDGGTSWTSQYSGPTNNRFGSVSFISSSIGFASGHNVGEILKTTNGGGAWNVVNKNFEPNNNYAVSFVPSTLDGWMVGNSGIVLKSTDGGVKYTAQTSGTTSLLTGVCALSSTVAWFTGSGGIIKKTTDGGTNWVAQNSGYTGTLYDIKFFDANNGLCVGDQGKILRTTNGGSTWTAVTSNSTNVLRNISFATSSVVFVVGHAGEILKSTNGGSTWTKLTSGTANNLIGSHFLSSTEGYACGAGGTILKTTDGGSTWTTQSTSTTKYFTKILFTNSNYGWAVGELGQIFRTKDGGKNWNSTKTFTASIINAITYVKNGDIVAACQTGMIGLFKENCPPPAPTSYNNAANLNACANTKAILYAAGEGAIGWYSAASGGTYLGAGETFITPNLTATTTYYAQDSTCSASSSRTAITVTIANPTITSVTGAQRCGAGEVTLKATASDGTLSWFVAASSGSSIATGTSFTTPTLNTTTTYYVEASNSFCISASRSAVVATISSAPTVVSVTYKERCGIGELTLSASASSGTINWYNSPISGTLLGTGTSYQTPSLTTTTTYYAEAVDGNCISASRTDVVATILTLPTVASVSANERCGSGELNISASASNGSIDWYDEPNNGNLLGSGATFITPNLTSTATYYAEAIDGNCTSITRTAVVATIKTTPNSTVTVNDKELTSNQIEANYQWYDCDAKSNIVGATNQKFTATKTGNYAVIVDLNGCADTSECVNISITGSTKNTIENRLNVFPNPCNNILYLEAKYQEYEAATIHLFTLNGQEVLNGAIGSKKLSAIDLSDLETGVYILKIVSSYNVYMHKIVKQ